MTELYVVQDQLYSAKTLIYDRCGFEFDKLVLEEESKEYGACSFRLNGLTIKFRTSKITPNKSGQFVTVWKRNHKGITQPFDLTDGIDFVVISSQKGGNLGQFIFPKSILVDKDIIGINDKGGKRGIRVYPPWDMVTSKQAEKTQNWQIKYFLGIGNNDSADLDLAKELFKNELK